MSALLLDLLVDQRRASFLEEAAKERLGREVDDQHHDRAWKTGRSLIPSAHLLLRVAMHDAHTHHLHQHRLRHHA